MTVTPMQRPPIRQSTIVRSSAEHTFHTFVRTLDQWWPLRTHSQGGEKVVSVTCEQRVGGRVYETWADGQTRAWGTLLAWDPPQRFALTWDIVEPRVTEVELTFQGLGPSLTRVQVEHRGWERLSEEQLRLIQRDYSRGWALILQRFADYCGGVQT